jgi:translocation and assembly module TamB
LIRGNVARGQITGSARIRGTAAAPEVDGGFLLADGVARLPLSVLRIPRAEAVFLPGRGLIPDVRATGRSKIPPYEVNVNVSGPVNNVQVHLSSEPPLPPNEVLALLATGSTTGALEDPANAQAKAAQLLVRQLRDSRLPFVRRAAALLGPLEEVQVQVGQESPFDGRARNGVTIEMTDRFLLTGAVDAEGNQRLTLTVLFRFR